MGENTTKIHSKMGENFEIFLQDLLKGTLDDKLIRLLIGCHKHCTKWGDLEFMFYKLLESKRFSVGAVINIALHEVI